MAHAKMLRQQAVVGAHHVVVGVLWELCVGSVAGFARVAMAYAVAEDDEEFLCVERLAWIKELPGKLVVEEL